MNTHTARHDHDHDVLDIVNAICLTTGNLWRWEPAGSTLTVLGLDGDCWITEEGNPNDYLLRAGESISFGSHGLIVVEALTPFACIRAYEGEDAVPQRGPEADLRPVGIAA